MARVQEVLAGRYELLDVIGRGGMGVVYSAKDRVLGRTVAVKVLPTDRAEDPAFVARFQREALAAAALTHPNIVSVFDTGQDDDTRFIVMEYVAGESLAQLVRRDGPLPPAEAARIAAQIASALAAAHRAGIVHRDIKPANAMLDERGTVKVLDFGIARTSASTSLTATSVVLGSASYLAPEVARGQSADARSDIYSLGCVLYELLTGRPPFTGELAAAVLHQHNTAIPRPPVGLNPAVPAGLDALIMGMLAKDPNQRPQRARELVKALSASLNNSTAVTASLPGGPRRVLTEPTRIVPRWPRLARAERVGLAVAGVVVIIALAIALLGSSSPPNKAAARVTHTARHRVAKHVTTPPRTVAAAAGALTSLTTQDLHTGKIDQPAAQAILAHVQDILTAYNGGHISDALQHLTDLTSQVSQLSRHGDIKSSARPGLDAAIANLRAALERETPPPTTTPSPALAPARAAPHPAPKPPAHATLPKAGPKPKPPAPAPHKPPHH